MRQSVILPRVSLVERDLVAMSKAEKQANVSFSMVSLFRSFVMCSVFVVCFVCA